MLVNFILTDLQRKMVIVTGSRQVGKTTPSKPLLPTFEPGQYLSWDVSDDRSDSLRQPWRSNAQPLVFYEIDKMVFWKSWLKGVLDDRANNQVICVTDSARMETFRYAGGSTTGRFFCLSAQSILSQRMV